MMTVIYKPPQGAVRGQTIQLLLTVGHDGVIVNSGNLEENR